MAEIKQARLLAYVTGLVVAKNRNTLALGSRHLHNIGVILLLLWKEVVDSV
jgi:hypothetical protein